jgi:hypothetical protein
VGDNDQELLQPWVAYVGLRLVELADCTRWATCSIVKQTSWVEFSICCPYNLLSDESDVFKVSQDIFGTFSYLVEIQSVRLTSLLSN